MTRPDGLSAERDWPRRRLIMPPLPCASPHHRTDVPFGRPGAERGHLSDLPNSPCHPAKTSAAGMRSRTGRYECAYHSRPTVGRARVFGDRRGITTAGQVALMTLGYRKVVIRIRKSAGLGYHAGSASPVRGFGEPHRNPTTQRHGGRSPQEPHGRNGTLRYTCYAC